MFQGLSVAVVVPSYNEADKLPGTLTTIPDSIDQVLVLDDASSDRTASVAESLCLPRLSVIVHPVNRGVGAAIVTGYRGALALGCDVAVVMAGDGQMDPADLPALLAPIASGQADYVKGNRFAHREIVSAMPLPRLLGNVVLSLLSRPATGHWSLFDSQCGYTAISRAALLALDLDRIFPRYGYPNDLLAKLWVAGMRCVDVPVRPVYGAAWRSGITLRTALYPVLFVIARAFVARLVAVRTRPRSMPPTLARPQVVDCSQGERSRSSSAKSSAGSSR